MKLIITSCLALCFIIIQAVLVSGQDIVFETNTGSPAISFAQEEIAITLKSLGFRVVQKHSVRSIVIRVESDQKLGDIVNGGFKIISQKNGYTIQSNDASGAMYGILELGEQIALQRKLAGIKTQTINPHFSVRALKFNLPWSPYRTGKVMTQHDSTCRDLNFWKSFLDNMGRNRFNVLSLWSVHPFTYMVKSRGFPGANNFSESEMKAWQTFWATLFRMAKDRGIETYIVNWNIAVSSEFASAYHVKERNDTARIVRKYTREVVKQVLNEYPDLTGLGVTLADWMSNFPGSALPVMSAHDREEWIAETFIAGMQDAKRKAKFIHRSVLSSDPGEMRRVIDAAALIDTTLVEIKFNWSHGHSTPKLVMTHDSHSGKIDKGYWDPAPTNYQIEWMVRNEDFFILRWGNPNFIREHITNNSDAYVNGYFVGSEGYIPALDFSHKPSKHQNWSYAFQKQWLFYMMWGRLLYDPHTSDEIFINAFDQRYGSSNGARLLTAWQRASEMPLKLASYYRSTWDYTLYSEGFLSPFSITNTGVDSSAFISIDELITQPTLDPDYQSIKEFVDGAINPPHGIITPLQLADKLSGNASSILEVVRSMRKNTNATLQCELDDLETWAFLSDYFAEKIRAGVSLYRARKSGNVNERATAKQHLGNCVRHWKHISTITSQHYQQVPYLDDESSARQHNPDARTFSWTQYLPQVEKDLQLAEF